MTEELAGRDPIAHDLLRFLEVGKSLLIHSRPSRRAIESHVEMPCLQRNRQRAYCGREGKSAMLKTRPAKEVVIRVPNAIGTLNEIARTLADKGINILAISSWVEGVQAVIRLVTDDSVRVLDALRAHKYDAREADVLVTEPPHKPGMLHRMTEKLAQADIDIHHVYATASASQTQCLLVFATANNDRAMVLLNASAGAAVTGRA